MIIPVLYEDEYLLVVDKPRNIHVHPTKLSRRAESVQDILQERFNRQLFPVHRLDRPVGGVLLMAKTSQMASALGMLFRNRQTVDKRYLCVVRGWMEGEGIINRAMRQKAGKPEKEAITRWRSLANTQAPWSDGIFPSSRYCLLECIPQTGRFHQIRRHLSVASHPIMGDIAHGDNRRNRIWLTHTGIEGLMLRAHRLSLIHPVSGIPLCITAGTDERFLKGADLLGWGKEFVSK